jgi:hypothetical protein
MIYKGKKWINVKSTRGKKPIVITVTEDREVVGDVVDLSDYMTLAPGKVVASVKDFCVADRHSYPNFEPIMSSANYSWYGEISFLVAEHSVEAMVRVLGKGELDLTQDDVRLEVEEAVCPGWRDNHG